jgi:glycerol-3-phosphate dehydrogenase
VRRDFSSLAGRHFDLLVCGGGIYGAWTAYDAALRGLSVAIVEQGDWASATSSASSKLIHGGLRYLENCDFKLVRKAIQERQLLLELGPHRVWPLRFGVPIYKDSRIGMLQLKAGLMLYDLLAGFSGRDIAHRHFDGNAFAERFPALDNDGLKGGFTYSDAQTDDARLVLELVAGAMDAGAACVNYCKLTGLIESDGQACGATVEDQVYHGNGQILARQIVYAAGQWMAASRPGRDWCRLSKGVHLVMPGTMAEEALLLTAKSDGRVFFMIPWYGITLIGTTDNDYNGDVEHVAVDKNDIAYLLAAANRYLKTAWTESDIAGCYAGVRVMKRSDKSSPSDVSRDWELKTASNGVHYSIGGKLTSAREDAAVIVDTVCERLGITSTTATVNHPLPWTPEEEYSTWSNAINFRSSQLGIDHESAAWLIRRHGKRVGEVLRSIGHEPGLAERIIPALPIILADLLYCARNEMVMHLKDLLRRRTPLLILANLTEDTLRRIAVNVAAVKGWDAAAINREVTYCLQK